MPRRTVSCSSIWKPTVNTGFSADRASWKIIAMPSPRTSIRRFARAAIRSSPWNRTWPPRTTAGGVSRMPMMVWAVTLLPEPDSPSTASVSPASTWYETPLRTFAVPSVVRNSTRRSSTSSNIGSPRLGVKGVADGVAEHHEREHGDGHQARREQQLVRGRLHVVLGVVDHHAPRHDWRADPDAEVPQRRLHRDERAQGDRGVHQYGRDRVGQHVPEDDPPG